jgi:putative FmdB family regulatory protein
MPTYEYKCEACGYAFERFHSMSAEPIKRCPECGKAKVKRLIGTGAGLIFKGSGFYITDYRDKSYTDKAKAESGGGSSTETKTDAKPAAEGAGAAATPPASDAKPAAAKSEPAPAPKAEVASKSAAKPKGDGKKKK